MRFWIFSYLGYLERNAIAEWICNKTKQFCTMLFTSLETQGQIVGTIQCSWWKFTVRSSRSCNKLSPRTLYRPGSPRMCYSSRFLPLFQCDLEEERVVSFQDGKKMAENFSCPLFETSAKNDTCVDEVFSCLARQMKASRAVSTRKAFKRDQQRSSLRHLPFREKKCKGRLERLRQSESSPSSVPTRRRAGSFRGFICGARTLGTT